MFCLQLLCSHSSSFPLCLYTICYPPPPPPPPPPRNRSWSRPDPKPAPKTLVQMAMDLFWEADVVHVIVVLIAVTAPTVSTGILGDLWQWMANTHAAGAGEEQQAQAVGMTTLRQYLLQIFGCCVGMVLVFAQKQLLTAWAADRNHLWDAGEDRQVAKHGEGQG